MVGIGVLLWNVLSGKKGVETGFSTVKAEHPVVMAKSRPSAEPDQPPEIPLPKEVYGRMLKGAVEVLWDTGANQDVVRFAQPVLAALDKPPAELQEIEADLTRILEKRRATEIQSATTYDQEEYGQYVELPPNPERSGQCLGAAIEIIKSRFTPEDAAFLIPLLEKSEPFRVWTSPIRVWVSLDSNGKATHCYQTPEHTVSMSGPWTPFSHLLPQRGHWMAQAVAAGERPPKSIIR